MSHLIDDLLELSHAGRAALDRQRVDVSRLVHAALDRLATGQPELAIERIVPDGVVAEADPGLLDIALTNLLANAWKFTGKRALAIIELGFRPGEPPTYFVRDNGAGFPADQADRLFDVFTRLHTARDFEGTGIGLATTQRVITRHGGRIWAEGAPDVGATFFFTLASSSPVPRPR
jgi:signal transduction histidine kinase